MSPDRPIRIAGMRFVFSIFGATDSKRVALRIALIYAIFGAAWILGTDELVAYVLGIQSSVTLAHTLKGCLYVVVTAALVYVLIDRSTAALQASHQLLQVSEQRYRNIVETASEGIFVANADEDAKITFVNARLAEMLGYAPDELLGRSLLEFMDEEWREVAREKRRLCISGPAKRYDFKFRRRDGSALWTLASCTAMTDECGQFAGVLGMLADITERKRAAEELDRFFTLSVDLLAIADLTGRFKRVNLAFERTLGYLYDDLLGRSFLDLAHPEDRAATLREFQKLVQGIPMSRFENRCPGNDGTPCWLAWTAMPAPQHGLLYFVGRNITEHKNAELALRASEERFRNIFEESPIGILLYDAHGALLDANRTSLEIFSLAAAEDRRGLRLTDDPNLPRDVWPRLQRGERVRFESRYDFGRRPPHAAPHSSRTGHVDLDVTAIPFRSAAHEPRDGYLMLIEDITERKQLEDELRQAQKMEAVGQLAGGVSHDFNNILTAILGHVELLRHGLQQASPTHPLEDDLDQIEHSGQRAAALTRQLLTFSRRQIITPELLDLNRILRDTEQMLRRLIREDIELEVRCAHDVFCIRADAGQIEQVVVNLAVNARDAMPSGGRLTIRATNVTLDAGYVAAHPEAQPGPHVCLSVRDTGGGIAPHVLPRIFEPFFTTKPTGEGSGLGLAIVHGIVKQFGGHIVVETAPARGSTFQVYLPAVPEAAAPLLVPQPSVSAPQGSETILVCEDDNSIRRLIQWALEAHGYRVLSAGNPGHALELATAHREPIHLLVTDVIMAAMNGRQLAEALQAQRPAVKVLFISGYSADAIAHHGVLDPGVELLEKPFRSGDLLRRVRAVLDRQGSVVPAVL
jgi:PAS domain S-box-containing protein